MTETSFTAEIRDQPAALSELVARYRESGFLERIGAAAAALKSASRVIFTGMGTSLYVPYIVLRELQRQLSVSTEDAGEFLHFGMESIQGNELVVAISQSGESAETRKIVERLQGRVRILSIVNDESSYMSQNSDLTLPIFAGKEASISNKTYTNTLALLLLLESGLNSEQCEAELDRLEQVADTMQAGLAASQKQARLAAEFLQAPSTLYVIARGRDLVSARQLALIAKEGSGLFAEALSAGLFRHGPIELAGPNHNILFLVSEGNRPELTENLAREVRELGSRVVVVSEQGRHDSREENGILRLQLPSGETTSRYFPILCAPFLEYFVHEVAEMKGKEAGVFQHARKITDRE